MAKRSLCKLCGEPMPCGEEMFNYHGYSGDCPKKDGVASEPAPTPVHKYAGWPGRAMCGAMGESASTANDDVTCGPCKAVIPEPAVERPTQANCPACNTYRTVADELRSELSSLRQQHEDLKARLLCNCPEPYFGTQVIGTPLKCERCGKEAGEYKTIRTRVEELKAALRTYGRHKDTWKCMTGERACASISGGKCDCGFEKALGTEEGNR